MKNLTWHRDSRTGRHYTDVVGNVEFRATITSNPNGWYLRTETFSRPLSGHNFRTLREAKAEADVTYRNIEVSV